MAYWRLLTKRQDPNPDSDPYLYVSDTSWSQMKPDTNCMFSQSSGRIQTSILRAYKFLNFILVIPTAFLLTCFLGLLPIVATGNGKKFSMHYRIQIGEFLEVKSVALIPTSSKLWLNPLWDVWFLSYGIFTVFEQFEDEILQVLLTSMILISCCHTWY